VDERNDAIVPLISSSVAGPLGARHLPRLWLKILLHAAGRLPEGYRHGSGGFDGMTLDGLGIDAAAFIGFIELRMPTYLECEAWVRSHGTKLDAASIAAHNAAIAEREKPDDMAAEFRQRLGIGDERVRNSIALNDLDDWSLAHTLITAAMGAAASKEPL
jgi:Domain of unknown function (DUF5069)